MVAEEGIPGITTWGRARRYKEEQYTGTEEHPNVQKKQGRAEGRRQAG
jgi:hypothetical protein